MRLRRQVSSERRAFVAASFAARIPSEYPHVKTCGYIGKTSLELIAASVTTRILRQWAQASARHGVRLQVGQLFFRGFERIAVLLIDHRPADIGEFGAKFVGGGEIFVFFGLGAFSQKFSYPRNGRYVYA